MKRKKILIACCVGLLVLAVVFGGGYLVKKSRTELAQGATPTTDATPERTFDSMIDAYITRFLEKNKEK